MMISRKKLLGLVPLVAVAAAFAVAPAGAQATVLPRAFLNGQEVGNTVENPLTDKNPQPLISWGTLELKNASLGEVFCQNIFAGSAENKFASLAPGNIKREGAGEGTVQAYQSYNCTAPECELLGGHIEISALGQGENFLGEAGTVEHITTPWEIHLRETAENSKSYELVVGNKQNVVGEPKYEKKIRFRIACAAKAVKLEFHGELHPKEAVRGSLIGAAPSEIKFEGATSGLLEGSPAGSGEVFKKVKIMGYEGGGISLAKTCPVEGEQKNCS